MITGRSIYEAYCTVEPTAKPWALVPYMLKRQYNAMADELNKKLIDDDIVTITAVRCPDCHEMLDAEHAEHHACFTSEVQQ